MARVSEQWWTSPLTRADRKEVLNRELFPGLTTALRRRVVVENRADFDLCKELPALRERMDHAT